MHKRLLSLSMMLALSATITAQSNGIGVGIDTDGLTGKYWMNSSNALSIHWNLEAALAVDYLFNQPDMLNVTRAPTPVYYGFGAAVALKDGHNDDGEKTTDVHLAARGVVGVSYYISAFPMDVYLEATPTLGLLGGGGLDVGGALGVRYFF